MTKQIKKASFISATLLTYFKFSAIQAYAQQAWKDQTGLNCTGEGSGITAADASDVATIQGFACLIGNVLSVAVTIIGMLALVMFVFASFKYLTSGGNSKSTEQAKGTITYAVVGLVVALSAFVILNLISNFTGIDVATFIIPGADVSP